MTDEQNQTAQNDTQNHAADRRGLPIPNAGDVWECRGRRYLIRSVERSKHHGKYRITVAGSSLIWNQSRWEAFLLSGGRPATNSPLPLETVHRFAHVEITND